MNPNLTDITVVLDRSGSMDSVATDTIGGFNKFLDDQQKAPGSATFTLHQFDHEFETPFPSSDIRKAPKLSVKTYVPRGSTALLDAIGRGINDTGNRLNNFATPDRAGKVVFVIITDGLENASHEFTRDKVFEMITHQRDVYKWEFVFLGANQDAIKTARHYGVSTANSMTYAANTQGVMDSMDAVSFNTTAYRSGKVKTMAFMPDAYAAQAKAGVKQPVPPVAPKP